MASRFEAVRGTREVPLVGRDGELAMLTDRWRQACEGDGQVVLLSGEGGIGKSRLVQALRMVIEGAAGYCDVYQCSPHFESTPFHPVIQHLELSAGFTPTDAHAAKRDKLERLVAGSGVGTSSVFAHLLSIGSADDLEALPSQGRQRMEAIRAALLDHMMARAGDGPGLLLIEDAQWIDPSTRDLLEELMRSSRGRRLLVLVTYRAADGWDWPHFDHVTMLSLSRFGRRQSEALAGHFLAGKTSLPGAIDAIVTKADGVPLFIEELARSIAEGGVPTSATAGEDLIPSTLRDSLMSNLDRLGPAKAVAQIGACIGREFDHDLIRRVAPAGEDDIARALDELVETGLLLRRGGSGDEAFGFRHALMRDVAYESMLRSQRRTLHAAVAEAMRSQSADGKSPNLGVLAGHALRGEQWRDALADYRQAAELATADYALREALVLYQGALKAVAGLDDEARTSALMDIHQARSRLLFAIGDFSGASREFEPFLETARGRGDRRRESDGLAARAHALMWAEDFEAALENADAAFQIAEEIGHHAVLGSAQMTTGYIHAVSGRMEPATLALGKTVAIARSSKDALNEAMALYMLGNVENWRGDFDEAIRLTSTGAQLARDNGLVAAFLRSQYAQAISLIGRGDYDPARLLMREGLALAEKIGDEAFIPRHLNGLGWLYVETENLQQGFELNERAADLSRGSTHGTGVEKRCFSEINMSDACFFQGDLALAGEILAGVHAIVRQPGGHEWMRWRYSIHLYVSLGWQALARGRPAEARDHADQALKIAVPKGSKKYIAGAWSILGEAAVANLDWEAAESWFTKAHALAVEIGHKPQVWRTLEMLARVHAETGRGPSSARHLRAARAVAEGLRDGIQDAELRRGMETSPLIRSLVERTSEMP